MKHYQVVAAAIENDGEILCVQKGTTQYAYTSHHWEFPGGKIEPGETPQQALRRELIEEMDFEIMVGEHLITVTHHYPDFIITMQVYHCFSLNRDIMLHEHEGHCWLAPDKLLELDWCGADLPVAKILASR